MAKKKKPPIVEPSAPFLQPSPEVRQTDDMLLRASGFRIRSRRVGEEAVWERDGRLYSESLALSIVRRGLR